MRDAFGGLMNMVIIVVFLVLVSGYLAFNVNYTKAFRVKNKIISAIEEYEGNCTPGDANNQCNKAITNYMKQVGYNAEPLKITGFDCDDGYCIKAYNATTEAAVGVSEDLPEKVYYRVTTAISIDIPIINKIMPNLSIFQVSGTTRTFKPSR